MKKMGVADRRRPVGKDSPMRRNTAAGLAAALTLCLAACGGGGKGSTAKQEFVDSAPAFQLGGSGRYDMTYAIERMPTERGKYVLTLTGQVRVASLSGGADTLEMFFSNSGQGECTGNLTPLYPVSSQGQLIAVAQQVRCTLTGEGPWQVMVAVGLQRGTAKIEVTDLTLRTVLTD